MASVSASNNHSQTENINTSVLVSMNRDDEPLILSENEPAQTKSDVSPSSSSTTNAVSSNDPTVCRLCHCQGTIDEPLISSCQCQSAMQYLHATCLQRLVKSTKVKSCEFCKNEFIMHDEPKSSKQLKKLQMRGVDKCKLICSITCIFLLGLTVAWSLYVLIEKSQEEVRAGKLQWPFWTKLMVVFFSAVGALICLYSQSKKSIKLCIRWYRSNKDTTIRSKSDLEKAAKLSSGMKYSTNSRDNCIVAIHNEAD